MKNEKIIKLEKYTRLLHELKMSWNDNNQDKVDKFIQEFKDANLPFEEI